MGESSSAPGSIPGMECLRSITPLAHRDLPDTAFALCSAQNRIRGVDATFASLCGQSRSSTAIERPKQFGRCGFITVRGSEQFILGNDLVRLGKPIPIGRAYLDGPLSLGYRRSGQPRAGSNPAPAARWLGFQLAFCPSSIRVGPLCFGYRTGSSIEKEQPVQTGRCGFDSRPETSKPFFVRPQLSTGRRIGLSLITTWSPVRVRPPEPNAGVAQW